MNSLNLSKRNLFRGRPSSGENLTPLPWTSEQFTDQCNRCGDCISSCEENIVIKGDGGFPSIDFKQGECTFCQACANSCEQNIFDLNKDPIWSLTAIINDQCLAKNAVVCRTCEDQCDQQAIQFKLQTGGRSTPIVSLQDCNGCGACYATCPTKSIQIKEAA